MTNTNYHVDLSDPRAQDLLRYGHGPRTAVAGDRVVQLAGDEASGLRSSVDLAGGKIEVGVVYGDLLLTVDVYSLPNEPVRILLICPRCHKAIGVPGDRKAIEWDPTAVNPQGARFIASRKPELARVAARGRISVAAFECPWEMGDDPHVRGVVQSGTTLCRQRLVIERNRARDA